MLRYLLTAIPITVLFVWLYNNTRGSVLFALLFHASLNASGGFIIATVWPALPTAVIPTLTWLYVGIAWLCMLIVVRFWGPAHLAKHLRVTDSPEPARAEQPTSPAALQQAM